VTGSLDSHPACDLLVVGGGINGVSVARDAAGRGLRVILCEMDDLASHTSSCSTKLIHGGLRYLEFGQITMVRKALRERQVLLDTAPHLVRPLRLVLVHDASMRPAWMVRAGLWLYDTLGGRSTLASSRPVSLRRHPCGAALKDTLRVGFEFSDGWTDDARLVVHNALGARELGARILTRHELVGAQFREGLWHAQLRDSCRGTTVDLAARALVNAAGPWVDAIAGRLADGRAANRIRLVKGSHIVVPRFWSGDHGYLLQNTDRRVVFVTPYEPGYALIGTTDVDFAGLPDTVAISAEETTYLCTAVNRQLRCALTAADVVHSYSGVRALVNDARDNPSAVTRDYVLDVRGAAPGKGAAAPPHGAGPLLTVLGGKITTFRRLAEQALDRLQPVFPDMGPAWTGHAPLPGGDMDGADAARARADFLTQAHFLPAEHATGLFDRHGSRAGVILGASRTAEGLGRHFGAGLYESEARHFIAHEWAKRTDDVLWRRTKFGLRLSTEESAQFARWMGGAVN